MTTRNSCASWGLPVKKVALILCLLLSFLAILVSQKQIGIIRPALTGKINAFNLSNTTTQYYQPSSLNNHKMKPAVCLNLNESLQHLISELNLRNKAEAQNRITTNKRRPLSESSTDDEEEEEEAETSESPDHELQMIAKGTPNRQMSETNMNYDFTRPIVWNERDPESGKLQDFNFEGINAESMHRVFAGGRRMAVIGDSTIRKVFMTVRTLLKLKDDQYLFDKAFQKRLNRQNALAYNIVVRDKKRYFHVDKNDSTHLEYFDFGAFQMERRQQVRSVFQKVKRNMQNDVDVVILNLGLRILHLSGKRPVKPPGYDAWIHYEHMLRELIRFSMQLNPKVILIKTTNRVCEEKFNGGWKSVARAYNQGDTATLDACQSDIRRASTDEHYYNFTSTEIERMCKFGTLTKRGSEYLNKRLLRVVANLKASGKVPRNTTLEIFDDRPLQSCQYTTDGRHFDKLLLSRTNLLAGLLDCLL